METDHQQVLSRIQALFDSPVIQNNLRGLYVEHMVAELLGEGWSGVGVDWAAWDLQHADGTRLEVKQSALTQTWAAPMNGPSRPSFSIRTPKAVWNGPIKTEVSNRQADIYVFAWHGVANDETDQRDFGQWQFFVVPTRKLPPQKSIALGAIRRFTEATPAQNLRAIVNNLRLGGRNP